MKVLAIVLLSVTLVAAAKILPQNGGFPVRVRQNQQHSGFAEVLEKIKNFVLEHGHTSGHETEATVSVGTTTPLINLIKESIELNGYKLNKLPDHTLPIAGGHATLTGGSLSGLKTVEQHGDALAIFNNDTNTLNIKINLSFEKLSILYKYDVTIGLIKADGNVEGLVQNFIFQLDLSYDYDASQIIAVITDVVDQGDITINFSKAGLLDVVLNLLSDVLVTLFKGFLSPLLALIFKVVFAVL